jgi:nitrate/nitrite transport system substrate-binding protein
MKSPASRTSTATIRSSTSQHALDRRQFLGSALTSVGAVALWSALGTRTWAATAGSASDAPESPKINFGMIALTDCSPIVIAHEKGFFKKYGINSTITKGANWAAIRDNLSSGSIQATHMLIGMPLASTMGLLGAPKKPMVIPWLLNRNGQAITLKAEWNGKVAADPKALKPFVDQAK